MLARTGKNGAAYSVSVCRGSCTASMIKSMAQFIKGIKGGSTLIINEKILVKFGTPRPKGVLDASIQVCPVTLPLLFLSLPFFLGDVCFQFCDFFSP